MMAVSPVTALATDPAAGSNFSWTFTSGSSVDGAFNFLRQGETLVLNYTLKATDNAATALTDTQLVTITITGSNDAPDITGTAVSATKTESDTTLSATGTLNVVDVDLADTVLVTVDSVAVDPSSTFSGTNPLSLAQLKTMMGIADDAAERRPVCGLELQLDLHVGGVGRRRVQFPAPGRDPCAQLHAEGDGRRRHSAVRHPACDDHHHRHRRCAGYHWDGGLGDEDCNWHDAIGDGHAQCCGR